MTYVGNAVIVPGSVAVIYDKIMSSPKVRAVLDRLDDHEERAVREALRTASREHRRERFADEADHTPDGAPWPHDPIDTAEAATMLQVTRRRAQQIAAQGMGHRDPAGRWWLDRAEVEQIKGAA